MNESLPDNAFVLESGQIIYLSEEEMESIRQEWEDEITRRKYEFSRLSQVE
jgi:hypothetical protein